MHGAKLTTTALVLILSLVSAAKAQQPPVQPPAAPPPAAVAEAQTPGIRAEVQQLKRDTGGTLTLRFAIINDSDDKFGDGCAFRASGKECGYISGVYLIDAANKKKYTVINDAEGRCICASVDKIEPHSRINFWAKFPAPPPNVQAISVAIPQFIPIDDVPIK
jgi:hypothetical protein